MDFTLNDEEQAIHDLVDQILTDRSTHERLKELAAADDRIDSETWATLAEAGVLGAVVPEAHGGLGLGFLATAMALQLVGAHASPIPLLSTAVMGAMPLAEFGTETQQARWLPMVADGSLVIAAAIYEGHGDPAEPRTTAVAVDGGYRLDGVKPMVADGLDAGLLLVPATLADGGCGVFLVPTEGELAGVALGEDSLLGGVDVDGAAVVRWTTQRAGVGMCMMMAGAAQSSIELAADYTKERQQFDRPIATFQAVSNRAGDTFIDTEAVTLTAWQAAWRIDQGLDADDAVSIARWWAAEAGFRVVHGAVHVHGGVGVDRDYPLHRHFLLARQIELTLGNGEEHLATLGRSIAAR